jgi:hypothetical protein
LVPHILALLRVTCARRAEALFVVDRRSGDNDILKGRCVDEPQAAKASSIHCAASAAFESTIN